MMKRRDILFLRMTGRPLFWTIDCVTYRNLVGNDPYLFDPVEVRIGTDAAILAKHGIRMIRSWFLSVHNCVIIVLVVVCIIPIVELLIVAI
jgi:hypothetical protein